MNPTKDQAPKNPKNKYGEAEYSLADDKENGARSLLIKLIKAKKKYGKKEYSIVDDEENGPPSAHICPELNFMNVGSGRGTWVYTHMCVHILAYLSMYVCLFAT